MNIDWHWLFRFVSLFLLPALVLAGTCLLCVVFAGFQDSFDDEYAMQCRAFLDPVPEQNEERVH